jgi:HSP20 family protein
MNLTRYNPNQRLSTRPNWGVGIFDELFNDFFSPLATRNRRSDLREDMNLKVDIYEKDNSIIINADLPGIKKEDISVDITGKLVTLGGERKSDEEIKEANFYRRERSYGRFQRTFNLPFEVNENKVKATYNNGILKLEIPKPEEQVAKRITIN